MSTVLAFEVLKQIVEDVDCSKIHLTINVKILHGILGIADEAGEFISIVKSSMYYNKAVDMLNLKEELGDLLWFQMLIWKELGKLENKTAAEMFEQIIRINNAKLRTRYGQGKYSREDAIKRDLDKERKAMEAAANE